MRITLHSNERKEPLVLEIGQAGNYGKVGYLEIEHEICTNIFTLAIANYEQDKQMLKWINLYFPNKHDFIYGDIKLLAGLFDLEESKYSNGLISYESNTPHGYKSTAIVALFRCEENNKMLAIAITLYGDYSRYPGLCVHLVGVEEVPEHIQENLSFLKEDI